MFFCTTSNTIRLHFTCNLIFINRTFRPTHVLSFLFHFLRTSRTIFLLAHRLVMYHSLCKSCLILRSAWEITINRFCRTPRTHRDAAAVPSLFSLVFRSHHQLTQNYGTLQCNPEHCWGVRVFSPTLVC